MLSTRHCMQPPMSRDDCYAATHPSDHNSVFIKGRSAWRRELRQVEWERRRVQEGKKVEKGKFWGKDAELEERYSRGQSHEYPFLSSAAKTPGYGCPHVQQAYAGSCAAVCPLLLLPILYCDQGADTNLGCIWMCRTPWTVRLLVLFCFCTIRCIFGAWFIIHCRDSSCEIWQFTDR